MKRRTLVKRLFNVRILMLTTFLLMGAITATAVERPQIVNRPITVERQFACRGTGLSINVLDGAGNVIGATVTISGTGIHLGLWVAVGELQFTPDPDNPTLIHAAGTAVITADNGDQLRVVMRDGITDITTALSHGSMQFIGGTGRFSAASGTVNFVVSQNFLTGAFEMTTVGSIRF
jgi:hypothetical protein